MYYIYEKKMFGSYTKIRAVYFYIHTVDFNEVVEGQRGCVFSKNFFF